MEDAATESNPVEIADRSTGEEQKVVQSTEVGHTASKTELEEQLERRPWSLLTLIIPLVAISPLFVFQLSQMLFEPARLFFPLIYLFIGWLVARQLPSSTPTVFAVRRWLSIAGFFTAAVIYALAVWQFSPWWAQVAGLLVFYSWALGRFGNLSSGVVLLWTACLATTLTLPFGWEQGLPPALSQIAAWCCSKTLDGLGLPHLWAGNLFELRDKLIVIDDVCGGWSSIYALMGAVSMLIIIQRRSLVVALMSALLLPVWMVLAYYIKLLSITFAHEYFDRDLASGWDFVLLDIGVFAFAFLCSWLFVRTMAVLFEPVPVGDAEFGMLFASMNKLLCWPQSDPFEDVPPQDDDDLKHFQKLKREKQKLIDAKPKLDWWLQPIARLTVIIGCCFFVLAACLPAAVLATGAAWPRFTAISMEEEAIERLAETEVPKTLGGWTLLGNEDGPIVVESSTLSSLDWQYTSPRQTVMLEVSFPFLGWSDPSRSFKRRSWTVGSEKIEYADAQPEWPIYEAELENDLGGRVYLFASYIDKTFQAFEAVPEFAEEDADPQPTVLDILRGQKRQSEQVTFQIRMICESGESLARPELNSLREQFDALRVRFVADQPRLDDARKQDGANSVEGADDGDASSDTTELLP